MPEPVTLLGFGGGVVGVLTYLARRYFEIGKEIMDIVAAAVLGVLLLPLMLVCALIIRLSGPGPILFTQVRIGKDGKPFVMYKLRTMHLDAESSQGAVWAQRDDPRVIRACRWMRRSHVDELPQLLNVIKGDMSLVGPRPERAEILAKLLKTYPNVYHRLEVRPGITGLAQIRAGYDTDIRAFRHKLEADLEYIANRCWALELWILARTLTKLNDNTAH